MAIDYGAGSGRRGAYQNLAKALQTKLDAQNAREAEDIRRKGLFGTGITQENLSSLANTGLAIADFGDKRMQQKMTQAQESFQRRQDDLFKIAKQYQDTGDYENAQLAYEQADMERNRFEDQLSNYRDKGILGSRFGSETVGYRRDPEAMKNFIRKLNQTDTKTAKPATAQVNQFGEAGRGDANAQYARMIQNQPSVPTVRDTTDDLRAGRLPAATPRMNEFGEAGRGSAYQQYGGMMRRNNPNEALIPQSFVSDYNFLKKTAGTIDEDY